MKHSVKIVFGEEEINKYRFGVPFSDDEKSCNEKEYEFKTKEELNAFLKGIDEAVGWSEAYYEI